MIDPLVHTRLAVLLVHLVFLASVVGAGDLVVRGFLPTRRDDPVLRLTLGAGVWGLLVFAAGVAGLLHRELFAVLVAVGAALAWPVLCDGARALSRTAASLGRLEWAASVLAFGFVGWAVAAALDPVLLGDAVGYHLVPVRQSILAHGFVDLSRENLRVTLGQLGTYLFTVPVMITGWYGSAKLVHYTFGLVLLLQVWALLRSRDRTFAAGALAFLAGYGMLRSFGAWAHQDLFVAFFQVQAVIYAVEYLESGRRDAVVLAGVSSGLGLASKLTAGQGIAALALLLLFGTAVGRDRRGGVRDLAVSAAAGLAVALPFRLLVFWQTGNPLAPLFARLVPTESMGSGYWGPFSDLGLGDGPAIPVAQFFESGYQATFLIPLLLIFVVLPPFRRDEERARWLQLYLVAYILVLLPFRFLLRYHIAFPVLLVYLAGLRLPALGDVVVRRATVAAVCIAALVPNLFTLYLSWEDVKRTLRGRPLAEVYRQHPSVAPCLRVNELHTGPGRVLIETGPRRQDCAACLDPLPIVRLSRYSATIRGARTPDELEDHLHRLNVRTVLLSERTEDPFRALVTRTPGVRLLEERGGFQIFGVAEPGASGEAAAPVAEASP